MSSPLFNRSIEPLADANRQVCRLGVAAVVKLYKKKDAVSRIILNKKIMLAKYSYNIYYMKKQ